MTSIISALCWLTAAVAVPCDDPVSLFDGQTLQGWDGDWNYWRVEKGAIVGEIPAGQTLGKNTWLVWRGGELNNFDLRLQFRLTGASAANSGIQFRSQVRDVDHVSGYQADIDLGKTWLGRIYDEHGRALLVERGTRVRIHPDGLRESETFAPLHMFPVLFRENDWNDYRIVAVGEHIAVYVNGTLFSELLDQETDQRDLQGGLALQLHSGPEMKIEFRDITLRRLSPGESPLKPFAMRPGPDHDDFETGVIPQAADGRALNLGFETGDLSDWTATGDAFRGQPVQRDGISQRWPGQTSNKAGSFFIGGFEVVQDRAIGALTSTPFVATHPFASFLVGGGKAPSTRVEVLLWNEGQEPEVIATASGEDREQMRRVVVDLRDYQGRTIAVRLVDEHSGGWGHLNFDDFRFHEEEPRFADPSSQWRSTFNPILQHLVPNPAPENFSDRGAETIARMFVPPGFSVKLVAAEPNVHQPIAFTFDARGRIWVVEAHSYPQKRPDGQGLDRILIFSDEDGDGTFETRTVFQEGLNLVSGMEIGYGGVFVGAAPQLLFIPDRDGDDRPDGEPIVLLDGFGYADTHETLNNFMWGPDGWLYGNQGVFNRSAIGVPGALPEERIFLEAGVWRYHPTRHVFEVFAHGGSNQWGLDYDDHGQIFMTTCRSYWGRGPTTHVMLGGHYWNQNNAGYAPFITARTHPLLPAMPNYLLASARYGHGEGGAGKPGSGEVYGGHSHVGTMIYLGDNWPPEYRNHLFTHNLHGHQINHQINRREAGGFNTIHAGQDFLFCADPQFVAVDLKYGPDGAVYLIDWYDQRHCHNPNADEWDRGNGRIYRLQYDAAFRPVKVDYARASDVELAAAQTHVNDWHVRTARRVLAERAVQRGIDPLAIQHLTTMALEHADVTRRLRAAWALHGMRALGDDLLTLLLRDESEYVRGWAIQLGVESKPSETFERELLRLAEEDPSLWVCRYLASAMSRVAPEIRWTLAERLAARDDVATDRDLPRLIWFGLAPVVLSDLDRALRLAENSRVPSLRDYVYWYVARTDDQGRQRVFEALLNNSAAPRSADLRLLEVAVGDLRGIAAPPCWHDKAQALYDSEDESIRDAAESIGAAFGDAALFARLRVRIANSSADVTARRRALQMLAADGSAENVPLLLRLLDEKELARHAIPLLGKYERDQVANELVGRLAAWQESERAAALEVLCRRVSWSHCLLDAQETNALPENVLTAYYVQQMANLGDAALNERISRLWGSLRPSSAELRQEIDQLTAAYLAAPLWAYSAEAGAQHFERLCISCHAHDQTSEALGPRLHGSGAKGIGYLVENVIDPNAVIGRSYLARIIITTSGQVMTGLIESETAHSLTIRTATDSITVGKDDIEAMRVSDKSFMPEGLLNQLNERERIELFKYLMSF